MRACSEDPTGIIFDIKKYAIHDGPGIRTTVFFKGCPLRCTWCHNPESWFLEPEPSRREARCIGCEQCLSICPQKAITKSAGTLVTDAERCIRCGECLKVCTAGARELVGRRATVTEVLREVERDVIFYDQSGGGVTFSGGEPLMQPEFLAALATACRERRLHTALDTTAYAPSEVIEAVAPEIDLFLIDLKHMDNIQHQRCTGVPNQLILDNVERISFLGKKVIVRIPVVPGVNDDEANLRATVEFAASQRGVDRIDLLPYNRGGVSKQRRLAAEREELVDLEPPTRQRLQAIAEMLAGYGLDIVIGG